MNPADAGVEPVEAAVPHTVTVARADLDRAPAPGKGGLRIVPAVRNGRLAGFRVYGIQPDTLFALLGLKNGDTLIAINDTSLVRPADLERMLAVMKSGKSFVLRVRRRGRLEDWRYTVTK